MEAIARRFVLLVALLAIFLSQSRADQPQEILRQVNRVSTALSDNDPSEAMEPFARSYPHYDELRQFFIALTNAYSITSEATVLDEDDRAAESDVVLRWDLNLAQQDQSSTETRHAEVHAHLIQEKGRWKIANISPIDFFSPQPAVKPGS